MNVLLGLTGSVATTVAPRLVTSLKETGHEVRVMATPSALYFTQAIDEDETYVLNDKDEWWGDHYVKDQPIIHIEMRTWADVLLIAPLSANTLAKMANGICDNLLTSVFRAWEFPKPIVLAPAMNTRMWDNPFTRMHLDTLQRMFFPAIRVVDPIAKRLACNDVGMGAMAEVDDIVATVATL